MTKPYAVTDISKIEDYCMTQLGITETELMQRAGTQAWQVLQQRWPKAKYISVMCGPGNNGGDGYVLARLAIEQGYAVEVYTVSDKLPATSVALNAYQAYREVGGEILLWNDQLNSTEVIVDALFGIGLRKPVTGKYAEMINKANHNHAPILALDVPSGLNADSGIPLGETIKADVTATFIANKIGFTTAKEYTGKVILCDLDLSEMNSIND